MLDRCRDDSSAPWSEDRRKDGDSAPHAGDSAFIPHAIENRGVATGIDRQLNPQISGPFPPPHQVAKSARSTSQRGDTGSNPIGHCGPMRGRTFWSPGRTNLADLGATGDVGGRRGHRGGLIRGQEGRHVADIFW
jgi:hypothetical protein